MESVYWAVAVGAIVAGFVQGLSGFAFGMVAMSCWAWFLEPQLAAVLAVCGAWTGQMIAAFTRRRTSYWQILLPFLAGGLIGVPLGTYLLPFLDAAVFKAFLGTLMVIWCPIMLMSSRLGHVRVRSRLANAVSGLIGGIMGGLGGMTGVIPTLWTTMTGLTKDEQRAVIQNFNLATLSVTLLAYIASGSILPSMLPSIGLVMLAVLIPVLAGARLYVGISQSTFRALVLSLLTLSGIAMLVSSVPQLLAR
ncbi:sulfite exporter TauE/SafE family protein [Alcaligenes sp. GCM10023179]|uniref:sulfite exporter TauE/SafE family protein n=1 Tax=Alcaligenes sp. GCM10023179 TaxID=3252633 RepID=UPI003621ED24